MLTLQQQCLLLFVADPATLLHGLVTQGIGGVDPCGHGGKAVLALCIGLGVVKQLLQLAGIAR